jgi:hypothetical protein
MNRSIVWIANSNPAEDMDARLLCFLCCLGSGVCEGLISRLDDSYWVCACVCVCVCVIKNFNIESSWSTSRAVASQKQQRLLFS